MGRSLGRSTALVMIIMSLAVVGLVTWAVDTSTEGSVRDSAVGRLLSFERSGRAAEARSQTRAAARKRRSPASPDGRPLSKTEVLDPRARCRVTGTVVDEKRNPVAGVKVSVRGPAGYDRSANSGKDGRFTIEDLATGTFDVFATHEAYVPLVRPGFTLARAGESAEVNFELPLGAAVEGIVRDEAGNPLSGVRIAARRQSAEVLENGRIYLDDTFYKTQKTDSRGTFTIAGVSLGDSVFEFARAGYAMEVRKVSIAAAAEQPKVEVVLKKTGMLEGVVLNDLGQPVSTTTVHLLRYKPMSGAGERIEKGSLTVTSDGEGRFKFTKLFTEGFYDLHVDDPRYAPETFPLVPVGSREVVCKVGSGGKIEGRTEFIDRATTPASVLVIAEAVVDGTTVTKEAKSDGLGRFTMEKLPYGKYDLSVRGSGLASEPKRDVAVDRNTPTRDVIVEVYEASTVKGRVADGRSDSPVAGASVVVEASYGPKFSRRRTFQTRTDQHGGFALYRLPGGAHVARASARGFLKPIADRSEAHFTLAPGERKSDLALVLDRGGVVDGFVLDHNGRPVEGADIQLFAPSNVFARIDSRSLKGRTDATGYFKVSGIEVGERTQLYASARKQGFAKVRSSIIDLTARKPEATTQLRLKPGGVVTGKVTDKQELPVPGALLKFESSEFPGDPSPSGVTAKVRPDGTYLLANIPPGQGHISVTRSGYVSQGRGVSVKDSEPTSNVNFKLHPGGTISGTVAALDGRPIAGARVRATGLDGAEGSDEAVTDRNGRFAVSNLGPGHFKLLASFRLSTPEGEQHYQFENPRVPLGSTGISIDCDVGNLLTGYVVDEEGQGVKGFTISLRSRSDTQPPQDFTFRLDRTPPDSRGSFQVFKIPRGVYSMRVAAEGYEPYVNEDLAVGPTRRTDLPRIRLRSAGGVRGLLVSSSTNRPVNGVHVRLISDTATNYDVPVGVSNAAGEFHISTAVTGTYDVEFSHPSYLPHKVEGVHVTARRLKDLGRLFIEAGGAIRGTVTDESGEPVRGMRVRISGLEKEVHTDAAGNYLFQGVQAGRWNVVARGEVNKRTVYSFQAAAVQPDETEAVDFRLETSADLDGLLAAASGQEGLRDGTVRIHPFDENALVLDDIHYDAEASPSDKRFEIAQVPPGPYFLWATGVGATNAIYTAWQTLNLKRGQNQTVVQVGSGQVRGNAVVEGTAKPAGNVTVQLRPLFDALRLPQTLYDKLVRTDVTSDNGKFQIGQIQPGPYQVLYRSDEGTWYAQVPFHMGHGQVLDGYGLAVPGAQ